MKLFGSIALYILLLSTPIYANENISPVAVTLNTNGGDLTNAVSGQIYMYPGISFADQPRFYGWDRNQIRTYFEYLTATTRTGNWSFVTWRFPNNLVFNIDSIVNQDIEATAIWLPTGNAGWGSDIAIGPGSGNPDDFAFFTNPGLGLVNIHFNPMGGRFTYTGTAAVRRLQISRNQPFNSTFYTTNTINNNNGYRIAVERNGFIFDGWYIGDSNNLLTGADTFTNTTTMHARWRPTGTLSTIHFAPSGGTWEDGSTSIRSQAVARSSNLANNGIKSWESFNMNPSRVGFVFDGWENPHTREEFDLTTNIYGISTTIQALWTPSPRVNITFNPNWGTWEDGGTRNLIKDIPRGESISTYTQNNITAFVGRPTREGYRFDGWFIGGGNPFNQNYVVNSNLTVTARWVRTPNP